MSPGYRMRPAGGRVAVGLALAGVLCLLALFSAKLALDGTRRAGGDGMAALGVFTTGQPVATRFTGVPEFTLERLGGGERLHLAGFRGRPVVVNFWASWCTPCRQEAALLERAAQTYRGRGVVFVGVNTWDTEPAALRFLAEFGVTYPSGSDPRGRVAVDFGVAGMPETFFLDREGRAVRKWIGPLTERTLAGLIDEIAPP